MTIFRKAFSMLELIFVIIIMGIIGTIGTEIFRNTYDAYTSSAVNNRLQVETELALKQIVNRLQFRFKDSVIARNNAGTVFGLAGAPSGTYPMIEWVGYDIDGWRGDETSTLPTWTGFIDVNNIINMTSLNSPGSDFVTSGRVDTIIANLSDGDSRVWDSAIFFTGANTNLQNGYGWTGVFNINSSAVHPVGVIPVGGPSNQIVANGYNFSGMDVYEQYKLAWTAYGLRLIDNDADGKLDDLMLFYDYQPWNLEAYNASNSVKSSLLMENVTTFKMQAIGDIIKVQLCVDNNGTDDIPSSQYYSLCKEKVVF